MKIRLHDIAHCRAGDKGNTSTLSVIAYDEAMYPLLCRSLPAEAVKAHLSRNITLGIGGVQLSSNIFWWTLAGLFALSAVCVGSLERASRRPQAAGV